MLGFGLGQLLQVQVVLNAAMHTRSTILPGTIFSYSILLYHNLPELHRYSPFKLEIGQVYPATQSKSVIKVLLLKDITVIFDHSVHSTIVGEENLCTPIQLYGLTWYDRMIWLLQIID